MGDGSGNGVAFAAATAVAVGDEIDESTVLRSSETASVESPESPFSVESLSHPTSTTSEMQMQLVIASARLIFRLNANILVNSRGNLAQRSVHWFDFLE